MPRPLFSDTFLAQQAALQQRHLPHVLFETDWNVSSKRQLDRTTSSSDHDDDDHESSDLHVIPHASSRIRLSHPNEIIQEHFLDPTSSEAVSITLRGLTASVSRAARKAVYELPLTIQKSVARVEEEQGDETITVKVYAAKERLLTVLTVRSEQYDDDEDEDEDEDEEDEMEDEDDDEEEEEEEEEGLDYSIEEAEEEGQVDHPATTSATDDSMTLLGGQAFTLVETPLPGFSVYTRVGRHEVAEQGEGTTRQEARGLGPGWAEAARAEEARSNERRRSFEQAIDALTTDE